MAIVANRNGTIKVETTEQGLPLKLVIQREAMQHSPAQLAQEILKLCQRSALIARVEQRDALIENGIPVELLNNLKLPTRDDIAREELESEQHDDGAAQGWLRKI